MCFVLAVVESWQSPMLTRLCCSQSDPFPPESRKEAVEARDGTRQERARRREELSASFLLRLYILETLILAVSRNKAV